MRLDRAELTGTGAAVLFHIGLIAALSMTLAQVSAPVEPPSMEVELVEDVGLQSAAPVATPPPSQAPEIGEATPLEPSPPRIEPAPAPAITPAPSPPKPAPSKAAPARPSPAKPAAKPAPQRPAPRVSRIGDDFLKGIPNAPATAASPKPSATVFSASALAGIQQAIRRQIQPCADQQVNPGAGANRIRVTLNLRLTRTGRLAAPPDVVRTSGVDDENARFEERVKDLAVAAYRGCSPLVGLPPDLYQTPQGGWSNINMTYRLP